MDQFAERERLQKKALQMVQERDKTWLPKYKDLRDNISPNDGQFEGDMKNDGQRRDYRINNPKPLVSSGRLAAGMSSGLTSKSRPWFELQAPEGVPNNSNVARWLYAVQEAIRSTLAKSNLYNILPQVYHSQGVYGTAAMSALPDAQDVVRFTHYPCGTYALATNDKGQVDTFLRQYSMTPRQMAQRFGINSLCPETKAAAERGDNQWVQINHLVEPNADSDINKVDAMSMPYRSTYWESGKSDARTVLRQGGFKTFPIMAPRWLVNGDNIYGTGPGDIALGKCRELQLLERDKMRLVQHLSNPNRTAPISLKGLGAASIVPGGITWVPDTLTGVAMQPTYTPPPAAIPNVRQEILECEQDIAEIFYEDLFLMITQSTGQMTAYEIARRQEEKMAMLGPVVERNDDELLDPLIDQVFSILYEQSMPRWMGLLPGEPLIPPPPEELQGVALRVEYISILAQAQKASSTGSIERAAQFTGMLMQTGFQDAGDKFNADAAQDAYYSNVGAPPTILRSADEVAAIREGRAQQMQQQQAMEQGAALVEGAKTLAETPTGGDTALSAIASAMQ